MGNLITDIPKAYFDRFIPRPRDGINSANMRNNFLALASCDFQPCRAVCSTVIETHDVGSDVAAAALYSGTGVTITKEGALNYEGIACIKAVVDSTGSRTIMRVARDAISFANFNSLGMWNKCAFTSSIQYVIQDSLGNESYWDITVSATPDNWEANFITLSSPDSNNGTNADLTDVVSYGYKGLGAGLTYYFDEVSVFLANMQVWIEPSHVAEYFYPFGFKFDGSLTDTFVAPISNPRIDLISINAVGTSAGMLTTTQGVETASPGFEDIPTCPVGDYPLYVVYLKPTMTQIVEYHRKGVFSTDGYIYADLRKVY